MSTLSAEPAAEEQEPVQLWVELAEPKNEATLHHARPNERLVDQFQRQALRLQTLIREGQLSDPDMNQDAHAFLECWENLETTGRDAVPFDMAKHRTYVTAMMNLLNSRDFTVLDRAPRDTPAIREAFSTMPTFADSEIAPNMSVKQTLRDVLREYAASLGMRMNHGITITTVK